MNEHTHLCWLVASEGKEIYSNMRTEWNGHYFSIIRRHQYTQTWSEWVSISRWRCFRLGDVVELWQRAVLSPDLVVVVNRLLRLVNVASQRLHRFTDHTQMLRMDHTLCM